MRVIWHSGSPESLPVPEDREVIACYLRLDEPLAQGVAGRARLAPEDLRDLAGGSDAMMRGVRRRVAKVLLAHCAGIHPDRVRINRNAAGAPVVAEPSGWFLSLAGQWPHCLIGVARQPLGVDVEPVGAAGPPDEALTQAEREWLASNDGAGATRLWVLKEAHAKCLGLASRIEAAQIETRIEDGDEAEGRAGIAWSAGGRTMCRLRRVAGTWQAVAFKAEGPAGSK